MIHITKEEELREKFREAPELQYIWSYPENIEKPEIDAIGNWFIKKFQDYQNEVEDIVKKATPNHVTREYRDTDKMRDTILQTLKGEEK